MTTTELKAETSANRTGVYLAVLQLVFTLGWTTYVIYLPKLAADVGIAPAAVILILMLDQIQRGDKALQTTSYREGVTQISQ